jgi:glutaredoxin-related protein
MDPLLLSLPLFLQDTKVVDRLEGADAAALTAKVAQLAATPPTTAITTPPPPPAAAAPVDVASRIKQLLSTEPVVLFMKGSTANPYCGFSRKVVEALQQAGCGRFKDVDILKDEELRCVIQQSSNPQRICNVPIAASGPHLPRGAGGCTSLKGHLASIGFES